MPRGRPRKQISGISKHKAIPKQAKTIASQRKFEKKARIRAVSHVTENEFIARHLYCITRKQIEQSMSDPEISRIINEDLKKPLRDRKFLPHCDHPEDGFCGSSISPENLEKVNDRLAHRVPRPKEEELDDLGVEVNGNHDSVGVDSVSTENNTPSKRLIVKIGGRKLGS